MIDTNLIEQLKQHLEKNKDVLVGEWIKKNSSYDGFICEKLNMKESTKRYWDAIWGEQYIEFKKGNSIWLDLVRFSEILLKIDEDASQETLTLFFIPNKEKTKIEQIICVTTEKLIEYVKLNKEEAKQLRSLKEKVPHSLNAQASLTKNAVRKIAEFIINTHNK